MYIYALSAFCIWLYVFKYADTKICNKYSYYHLFFSFLFGFVFFFCFILFLDFLSYARNVFVIFYELVASFYC